MIHTVGPVWSATEDRSPLLADCHHNALKVAQELGARSIAFPAISTGIYRWPIEDAARIANAAVRDADIELIRFVLFDEKTLNAYRP
ncbi:macro domain-containing protein [Lentzea sp. NPDC058450]|uniref:macro domain-containing protein n=1 Tax=Lentzea sp. NPDC058450 TaxID=3346505 RepID=UPI00364FE8C2